MSAPMEGSLTPSNVKRQAEISDALQTSEVRKDRAKHSENAQHEFDGCWFGWSVATPDGRHGLPNRLFPAARRVTVPGEGG